MSDSTKRTDEKGTWERIDAYIGDPMVHIENGIARKFALRVEAWKLVEEKKRDNEAK